VTTVGPCYVFDISGGFEAYLGRLSHKNRQQARKLLRAVDQAGLTFDLATNGELITTYFDQMVTLHKERWTAVGKTSSFAPRHAEFHRSMAHLLAPTGAVVLARLALGKTPFAVVYGHRVGEKMYCYQQGVAPESDVLRSPGTVAWLLLMRTMAEQGVTLFDQQSGTSGFKERFATGEHPLAEMRVARPTLRHMATATVDLARRGTAKLVRRLKKPSLSGQPLLGKDPVSLPREPVKKV